MGRTQPSVTICSLKSKFKESAFGDYVHSLISIIVDICGSYEKIGIATFVVKTFSYFFHVLRVFTHDDSPNFFKNKGGDD